ncbi:MAG: PocR ligand-binding domain-containing protein [Synergistaceae bacterium]|jgi:ligand-binding sensor protein|nr:PocR ligand-binding domain-containing protein [Synergistaceae bacterium]
MDASLKLTDILPPGDIQKFQDSFAEAMKFTAIIVDPDGTPVTQPSNWSGFCSFFYSSDAWSSDCHFNRLQSLAQSRRTRSPSLSICPHTGLTTTTIPIFYGETYLGSWAIGQIKIEELQRGGDSIEKMLPVLSHEMRIGLGKVRDISDGLPLISMADFETVSRFLQTFSETVLRLAESGVDVFHSGKSQAAASLEGVRSGISEGTVDKPVKVYASSRKPFDLRGKCMNIMLSNANTDAALRDVLETAGRHVGAERAFIFVKASGASYTNRYDWREFGPNKQRQSIINVKMQSAPGGIFDCFRRNAMILSPDKDGIPADLKSALAGQSIKSIALLPMWEGGELMGFLGFGDSRERQWGAEEITVLWNLSMMAADRLMKEGKPLAPDGKEKFLLKILIDTVSKLTRNWGKC